MDPTEVTSTNQNGDSTTIRTVVRTSCSTKIVITKKSNRSRTTREQVRSSYRFTEANLESPRKECESGRCSKRPRLEADEVIDYDAKFPDHSENLLSPDFSSEYKERVCAAVDFKSKFEPVTTNVNIPTVCKHDRKLHRHYSSPIDINRPIKLRGNKASAVNGLKIQNSTTEEEMSHREQLRNEESSVDDIKANCFFGPPSTTYPGQLLWVLFAKWPYWPAMVFVHPDENPPKGKIYVKFFGEKGKFGIIKKENSIEFQGIDSFVQYREAMVSKLKKTDWKAKFHVKAKAWPQAIVEITFLETKDVDVRLALFDIIRIGAKRDTTNSKKRTSLSQLISQYSTASHPDAVKNMYADNANIFEDVKQELAKIPSTNALTRLTSIPAPAKPKATVDPLTEPRSQTAKRRKSLSTNLTKLRASKRLASIVQKPLTTVRLSINSKKPQKCKRPDPLKRKEEKRVEFEEDLELYSAKARQKTASFKGLRRGNVCKECLTVDEELDRDLVKCSGNCADHVHRMCAAPTAIGSDEIVWCRECSDTTTRICYACKETCSDSAVRCSVKACGRFYHMSCLDDWLQTKVIESGRVWCPTHTCHTCVSDDPQNTHVPLSKDSLSRCIKCPTTYHANSACIPAGVKILTRNQHVCIRHRKETRKRVNVNWCYLCGGLGGELLCCDSCPLASHLECLHIKDVGEHYVCDSCETGRHPLHGEAVWVRYSSYRWWPAVIVPPAYIPIREKIKPNNEHNLFVRFFGTYDCGWVGRSFAYLCDESDFNDQHHKHAQGNVQYYEAIEQAEEWYERLRMKVTTFEKTRPFPYSSIMKVTELAPAKLIKTSGYDPDPCNCSPDDPDPCGPTSNCDKREAWTECDSRLCPAGENCQNQCIGKRKHASMRLKHFDKKGFGLIAETVIRAGTMITEYVGELVTEKEYKSRLMSKQRTNHYFMQYGKGLYIDAELKGNLSRFINHSCNPNCQTRFVSVKGIERIAFVAMKDIKKGAELTLKYKFDNKLSKCYCGEAQCRGYL